MALKRRIGFARSAALMQSRRDFVCCLGAAEPRQARLAEEAILNFRVAALGMA